MALISYLTRIHFADDVLQDALRAEVELLGCRRPLILTDLRPAQHELVERVVDLLPPSVQVQVVDVPCGDPTEAVCLQAVADLQDHEADGLIGLGGGGAIDLAKAVGLMASHGGRLVDYAAVEGGIARIRDRLPPLIAVPTTAGSGSEVAREALVVTEDGRRLGLISPFLIPKVAICDPTLTLGQPPALTADAGMDALSHCIETYIAIAYNPPADGIALDGLRRAARHLERVVENGRDLAARREMMAAAMNGALALQKGLGGVHAMSHALGALGYGRQRHGTLNAILLPHVLEFNAPAVGHRYDELKHAMGLKASADLASALDALARRLALPAGLCAMGIDAKAADRAALLAERDHTHGTNPRRATRADYRRLLRAAL